MVDHYEQYNRTGRVTRDTGDWTHIPFHVRITEHPDRIRLARQAEEAAKAKMPRKPGIFEATYEEVRDNE
jgi:hypothetical protein